MGRERSNLSRWCLGEPSSSNTQNEINVNERKTELGWSSSISPCAVSGPRLEERGCSLEGRRVSCKRKAIEGNVGQSSISGSCSYFQHAESSARTGVPTHYNVASSLSLPASSEQGNPRLRLGTREVTSEGLPDSSVPGSSESSRRNFRVRINPNQQNSISPSIFSTGRTARLSSGLSSQLSPSVLPVDHSMDLQQSPSVGTMNPQSQPAAIHVPALPQNMQSLRWSGGSSTRTGSSSSSMVQGDRDAPAHEELSSRSLARNMLDHPIFVPSTELRNLVRPGRSLNGGSINIPGNVPPASRPGSSSSVHPSSAPRLPHHNSPPHYPRLSEYVRRSLFSSAGPESGGQSSNYLPLHSGQPASSQEMVLSSGAVNQGYHQAHPRSASWIERQNDGGLGIHYSLRNLAAAGEGSNRLVSEDVMILDQSVFFGVADIHDRHRDMRLDVDNMSYEELLALEERIGNVSTGLSEETILNRLKEKKYSVALRPQLEAEPCCICQEDYNEGVDLGTLECGHDFHKDCIKQWLMHKNLCPISNYEVFRVYTFGLEDRLRYRGSANPSELDCRLLDGNSVAASSAVADSSSGFKISEPEAYVGEEVKEGPDNTLSSAGVVDSDGNSSLKGRRISPENDFGDFSCDSEKGIEGSEVPSNPAPSRSSSKRSRAAEVHNLSEKRRRSRINEKMKALQNLIPNSNKTDKASMLDEAIEYLKQLQLQVQMLSMRNGFNLHSMCLPEVMHPMQLPLSQTGMGYNEGNKYLNSTGGLTALSSSEERSMQSAYNLSNSRNISNQPIAIPSVTNITTLEAALGFNNQFRLTTDPLISQHLLRKSSQMGNHNCIWTQVILERVVPQMLISYPRRAQMCRTVATYLNCSFCSTDTIEAVHDAQTIDVLHIMG
ncbi:hypothetical protein FNV43_RR13241 [Rhamnella rubrinervis]|uniref:RING-type E3 ubiquitin transferase n=1 Tax=Rhamnella rubrinervis TaxID=2594499 RepID=A0A8K0MEW1_9ROSA|nr:hypothetical protein FNV43_RR13241 [Rhamnella rubrinervis]